jgi:hypothetical protein
MTDFLRRQPEEGQQPMVRNWTANYPEAQGAILESLEE